MSVYGDLATILRRRIQDGVYPPGSRLPARDVIAREFETSIDVVKDALRVLELEGLVSSKRGERPLVCTEPTRTSVVVPEGAIVTARMSTSAEMIRLGCDHPVPMLVVSVEGKPDAVFPAGTTELTGEASP